MKKYSGRAADPVDDKVLATLGGSQLAAVNPFVWALALRWGSALVVGAPLVGHHTPTSAQPVGASPDDAVAEAA